MAIALLQFGLGPAHVQLGILLSLGENRVGLLLSRLAELFGRLAAVLIGASEQLLILGLLVAGLLWVCSAPASC